MLFEISRLAAIEPRHGFGFLSLNLGRGLCRRGHAPKLVERVHIERQVEEPSMIIGHGGIGEAVEGREPADKVPHGAV